MKRYLNSLNHETQNIEAVNYYFQQKLNDQQS